ncbi:MAG: NADPH:quinone reductase, partial [Planctomycetota bacterium]
MKAAFITQTGGCNSLTWDDFPEPAPGPEDVVIEVAAAAVNPIDTYVRSGAVAMDLPLPFVPGCDAAGVVTQIGDQVRRVAVGDRVWTTNQGLQGRQGTIAERIAVDQAWVYSLPEPISFQHAAAAALVGVTAHLGLHREVKIEPGESLLVIGGAGGVGSMVVQLALASGLRVIATGTTSAKRDYLRSLGVDSVIDPNVASIADSVRDIEPDGVNVFWETRREPDFELAVGVLAPRGRMVLMAGRDATPAFPVGPFYVNELSVHGFVMFKATPGEMRRAAEDLTRTMLAGKLTPPIGLCLPMSEAAEAHRRQEAATLGSGTDQ